MGRVRKTNVSGLSAVLSVERRAERLVSPVADLVTIVDIAKG